MKTKTVSIIAGGYLGQRLATALSLLNYSVKLSFRTKLLKREDNSISAHYCSLNRGQLEFDEGLFDADCLVICLPPGFKQGLGDFYAQHTKCLLNEAQKAGVKQVIFTSSVGIYPQSGIFDETSELHVSSDKQQALYDAEQTVLSSGLKYKQVLRLAGLIGDNRHPGNFRVNLSSSNLSGTVNMVVIDDVVQAILTLINSPVTHSNVYNLVSPHHPQKPCFYRYARQAINNAEVSAYHGVSDGSGKKVCGDKIEHETDFAYQHRNLFTAINSL